jgi:hypothetical protein
MTTLGRFGHHPDPAIDFCVEVDAIEGIAAEVKVGLADRGAAFDRASRAENFRVGGDPWAVKAMGRLREIGDDLGRVTSGE